MRIHSSRRIDTGVYKTLDILKFFVSRSTGGKPIVPVNKKETMFRTFCPLHIERTPSFTIYSHDAKTALKKEYWEWGYKCFGCGRSGDVFTFLRDTRGMQMWDSLAFLRKTFPDIEKEKIIVGQNQLKIPFPQYRDGTFAWISQYMDEDSIRAYTAMIYVTKRRQK